MDGAERDRECQPGAGERPGPASSRVLAGALDVAADLDFAGQARTLASLAARWTDADAAFVLGPEEDPQVLVPLASEQRRGEWDLSGAQLSLADVRAWVEGEPPASLGSSFGGTLPAASHPVALRGKGADPIAMLVLVGVRAPGAVSEVSDLAEACRRFFENACQVRAIRELVIQDDTVQCYNRRYFEEFLTEELARASRFHAPLSLIFFDMDGLKQVNSLLGHAMGSRCLYEVSVRVRGKVRKFDRLFRFGGDEFCIVLPETEWHGALEVAERVRVAIAGKLFLAAELGEKGGVKMTASFGIASFPLHARAKGELLERADWAMQRVKNGLKNAIAVAEIAGEEHGS